MIVKSVKNEIKSKVIGLGGPRMAIYIHTGTEMEIRLEMSGIGISRWE